MVNARARQDFWLEENEDFLVTNEMLGEVTPDSSIRDETSTLNLETDNELDGDYAGDDHLLEQYLPQIWRNNDRNIAESIDYFKLAHLGHISSMLKSEDPWVGGAGDEHSGHSREQELTSFQCLIYALSNFGAIDDFDPESLWSVRPTRTFAEQRGVNRVIDHLQQKFQSLHCGSGGSNLDSPLFDPQGISWPAVVAPYMSKSEQCLLSSEAGEYSASLPLSDSYEGVYQMFSPIIEAFNNSRHGQYQPTQQEIRDELSRNLAAFFDSDTIDLVLDTVLSSYFIASARARRPHDRQRRKSRSLSLKHDEESANDIFEMDTRSVCKIYRKYLFSSHKAFPVTKSARKLYAPSDTCGSKFYVFDSIFTKARPVPGNFLLRDMLISPRGLGKSYFSDHNNIRLFDSNDGNGPICMSRSNSQLCTLTASLNCLIGCSIDGTYGIESLPNGAGMDMQVTESKIPAHDSACIYPGMPAVSHVEMSCAGSYAGFATTAGILEILDIKTQKFASSIDIRRLCKDGTSVSLKYGLLDYSISGWAHLVAGPTRAMVIDIRSEELSLAFGKENNSQYTCSSTWSPDGVYAAIGTQSHSCMLFDIRSPYQPVLEFVGNLGAIRNVQFDRNRHFLAAAEPVDNVHLLSLDGITGGRTKSSSCIKTDLVSERHQVLEFWGDIAGISFTDSGSLLVGISDVSVGGILDYAPLCQRFDVIDSICL